MIGIDIAKISRVQKAVDSAAFRDGVFTAEEQAYCDCKPKPHESYAGLFCAKEAAVKALKSGFGRGIMPIEIEITHDENGAPRLKAHGNAEKAFSAYRADVSISHDGEYAIAAVMLYERIEK